MRRFLTVLLACLAPALLISCGGNSTKPLPIAKVQIIPAPVTVNQGAVVQLTATAVDSNGVLVAAQPSFTFNVTNSGGGAISLSPVQGASVQLCAGTWDASFINCTPGPVSSAGTVTASGGGFTSDPVQVFVHVKVGRVSITTPAGGCGDAAVHGDRRGFAKPDHRQCSAHFQRRAGSGRQWQLYRPGDGAAAGRCDGCSLLHASDLQLRHISRPVFSHLQQSADHERYRQHCQHDVRDHLICAAHRNFAYSGSHRDQYQHCRHGDYLTQCAELDSDRTQWRQG